MAMQHFCFGYLKHLETISLFNIITGFKRGQALWLGQVRRMSLRLKQAEQLWWDVFYMESHRAKLSRKKFYKILGCIVYSAHPWKLNWN